MAGQTRKRILVCSCEGTMPIDREALQRGLGDVEIRWAIQLCGAEIGAFRQAAGSGAAAREDASDEVIIACTAQQALFEEIAEDDGLGAALSFVNVRETAGWSNEARDAGPKMAALIAAAAVQAEPVAAATYESEGVTLIYGRDQRAIEVAEKLKDTLDITVLLAPGADVVPPRQAIYPVRQGRVRGVKGHLGAFEITVDRFAEPAPSSRATYVFGAARDGAVSKADILIDLSGGAPLVSAADLRAGYLRAEPSNAAEVARVVFEAAGLTGTFDKPRYVTFREDLCAHKRSRITGCTRCLDLCPAGAISSGARAVVIDPHICAGCGQCAAACPTGAATYAVPTSSMLIARLRAMLAAYRAAGGAGAQILIHDEAHGGALIDAAARFGDGLPARMLPLAVNEVTQVGIDVIASAFAYGAVSVQVLVRAKPRHDIAGLRATIATARALTGALGYGARDGALAEPHAVGLIETDDPDALVEQLRSAPVGPGPAKAAGFAPVGSGRDIVKLALRELHRAAPAPVDVVPLEKGAAFGGIEVRTEGCTLCLSCVSACPTRALSDAQDRPQLSFDESLCVQCGLCAATCPEKVITLQPRIDFAAFERGPRVVKEEEPYCCTKCGKAFGVKSTIERVIAKLEGQHWMFTDANRGRVDLIKMCEDCRVEAAINMNVDPFAGPARPAAKTSEDYFREREARERTGAPGQGQTAGAQPHEREAEAKALDAARREADMLRKIDRGEV